MSHTYSTKKYLELSGEDTTILDMSELIKTADGEIYDWINNKNSNDFNNNAFVVRVNNIFCTQAFSW